MLTVRGRERESSGKFRIKKPQRQLWKERTKRQTKNSFDCDIADHAEILRIWEFLQTTLARTSAAMFSSPCGEADRPTSVVGGKLRRRISHRSRIGPIKEINIFNKAGSSGIDVKLPSAKDPEVLVWVSTLTDEVQNCRQNSGSQYCNSERKSEQ